MPSAATQKDTGERKTGSPAAPPHAGGNGKLAGSLQTVELPSPKSFPWAAMAVVVIVIAFPHLAPFSMVGVAIQAAQFAIVTTSLVLLTGWVGQISLGHAALVGIGAFATGWAIGGLSLPFPINILLAGTIAGLMAAVLGGVALRVRGLYLAVATLIFSWMADAFLFRIDFVVRHSFIDVPIVGDPQGVPRIEFTDRTTMYYIAWGVAILVIFLAANIRDSRTGRAFYALRGSEVGAASLGIDVTRYKLLAFTFSGFLAGLAGGLVTIDSRSLSPDSFQFTVSLFYLAMAVVGGLTSLGGAVASSILFAGLNEIFFRVRALGDALDLVSAVLLAVVLLLYRGGLAAVPGTVKELMARLRTAVQTREPSIVKEVREGIPVVTKRELHDLRTRLASGSRRTINVLAVPFTAAGRAAQRIKERLPEPLAKRMPSIGDRPRATVEGQAYEVRLPQLVDVEGNPVELTSTGEPRPLADPRRVDPLRDHENGVESDDGPRLPGSRVKVVLPPDRDDRLALLDAEDITVRFGGLTAVNDASLSVREHEITALIGPNGAGKTTLFNAIAGLNNPTEGRVRLFGHDVTDLPVHLRAQMGVARTFQAIQLFPQLTVFENLLVATHLHNRTGFFEHLFAVDSTLRSEIRMRERVAEVVEELRLTDVAYRPVADLPFGVLRMVEVARAMVTDFPLVMLDEPASGLDNSETDRLAEMLFDIRAHGITLLLIEHDVRMVVSVSDYVYVLNRGEIIADATPDEIQRDPAVMAAYLGEPAGDARDETVEAQPVEVD